MFGGTQAATWWSCCVHTHGCCPGDLTAVRAACLFASRCWELLGVSYPSSRLIGTFVSTCPLCCVAPCCLCRAPRGKKQRYQNTAGAEESWVWVLFFSCNHAWLCKSARSEATKSFGSLDPLSLFVALCPAHQGGVRGRPWHSMLLSKGDSSHRIWTQ